MHKISILSFILLLFYPLAFAQNIALSTKNKKAILLYQEGENYRVRGQYTEAIIRLNKATKMDKHFFEAYRQLALIHYTLKDYPTSTTILLHSLATIKNQSQQNTIFYFLGEVYLLQGEYEKSVDKS